jgi:alcohol dehydrogenase
VIVALGKALLGEHSSNRKLIVGMRVVAPFILSCGSCTECSCGKSTVCLDQKQPGFTQWGSFAEYVAIPRAERNVCVLPKYQGGGRRTVSFVEAAALGCRFTTAYRAVVQRGLNLDQIHDTNHNESQAKSKALKTLAIFGCGGVGLSCIMIGRAVGQFDLIIAVDVAEKALSKAMEVGATHVVHASRNDTDGTFVREKVRKLTPNQGGADVSIDAAGFKSTCENAVYCTRRGGRMVQVGLPLSGNDNNNAESESPQIPMAQVAGQELELVGSHGLAASDMAHVVDLVARGKLAPNQLVERHVTLAEGAQALMDMDHGSPLGITMITSFECEVVKPSTKDQGRSKL